MKLYFRIVGTVPSSEKIEVARNSLRVLKNYGINLDGGFSFAEAGETFIRVNQFQGTFGVTVEPCMLVFGFNQNEWFGDKARKFELDLGSAIGIPVKIIAN